jgi:hypothetical protein
MSDSAGCQEVIVRLSVTVSRLPTCNDGGDGGAGLSHALHAGCAHRDTVRAPAWP